MGRLVSIYRPDILDSVSNTSQMDYPLHILLLQPTDNRYSLLSKEVQELSTGGMLDQDYIRVKLHYPLLQLLVNGQLVADEVLEPHLHSGFIQRVLNHYQLRFYQSI